MAQRREPNTEPDRPEPAAPASPASADEPEWAASLRRTIEELPGKLRATISDDDRRSIAEGVHDLFERAGAFIKPDEPPPADEPDEPEVKPEPSFHRPEPQPETRTGRMRGFAARHFADD